MPRRPRVLLVHNTVAAHGGACSVLAWSLQALQHDYDVTLLSSAPWDAAALNRYYGTSIDPAAIISLSVHPAVHRILRLDPDPSTIQPNCYLMRKAKRLRTRFDCAFGTDNETDLGPPALQYIHYPHLAHVYPKVRHNLSLPPASKLAAFLDGSIRPWMLMADFSFDRMRHNRTLVNSDWTGRWVQRVYGVDSHTITPPAAGDFPETPWDQREDGFVLIGRLATGKRILWCIGLLNQVRRLFPQLRLHIAGSVSRDPSDARDAARIAGAIRENSSWVIFHDNIPRAVVAHLLSTQKYGLHAMIDEHFGIAVAEMLRAGCIPFVHNSGGPPGIVGGDPRLTYDSAPDAVEKIVRVLRDPFLQINIASTLAPRKVLYSPERFMDSIRGHVNHMTRR
jgi:glycosyltransferase involved in cell wall biosynthesis